MGLRGPIPLHDPARGNPGRRNKAPVKFTPKVQAQLQRIFNRERRLGDKWGKVAEAEAEAAEIGDEPSEALMAALKCWSAAATMAFRIGGLATPEEKDELAAHLAKRTKAPRAAEG